MLKEFKSMISSLETVSSTNKKKDVIKDHCDGYATNKKLLHYALDDTKMFHITSKVCKKNPDLEMQNEMNLFDILDRLTKRENTGHDAIALVNGYVAQNKEYEDIIFRIIDKDLKCKTGASLVNKVYPKYIPEFDVALAVDFKKQQHKVDFEKQDWGWTRKLDGCVSYDTLVEFEDGSLKKIGDVVENNIMGNIKSFNTITNEIEYQPILSNYTEESDDETQWYEIELEDGTKLEITGNDRLWLPELNCYRKVLDLDGTESILKD